MTVVYRKPSVRRTGMTQRNIESIAKTLSFTNRRVFMITRANPFEYIKLLREYGVEAKAVPVLRDRKIVGYNFLNAS